jgi:hypothetical protein
LTRATRIGLALAAALLPACARSLEDLEPYPCPSSHPACPDGRSCVPGVGCVTPFVDAPCNQRFTDCTLAASDAVCLGGTCNDSILDVQCEVGSCAPRCSAGAGCAAGRTCTSPASEGVCVVDCTDGAACPAGLACEALPGGRSGCVPASAVIARCASVEVTGTCDLCGAEQFTVSCAPAAGFCTLHSTCIAGGDCMCDDGFFAYSCADVACGTCGYPDWYCRPMSASPQPSCDASTFLTQGRCHCADGSTIDFACGETATCEERCTSA